MAAGLDTVLIDCYGLTVYIPPQIHMLKFKPLRLYIVLGDVFGKWLDHEDRALMNGICGLKKEAQGNSFTTLAMWGHSRKTIV